MRRAKRQRPLERRNDLRVAFPHRCVVLLAMLLAVPARATGLPWEIWESPSRLAVLDAADDVLERSSHCLDGCRYDRSNQGPENLAENPYPLRWLYRDGEEAVVFDERGPGAVTRLWLTMGFGVSTCIDPAIRVRFYVDDAPMPALDIALAALFDGSTLAFTPPLVADRSQSSGGYFSYVPIAYAQALRIALVNIDNGATNPCTGNDERLLWFQIQHHRLAPGTKVASFTANQDFAELRAFLVHAGDDPWNGMLTPLQASSTLAAGATLDLATRPGPGWLRGIRFRLPRSAYDAIRLQLDFDGATAVDATLADFFATSPLAAVPPRGVLAGEDADGWLYAWLPMPFHDIAAVRLIADATLPSPIAIDSALSFDDAEVSASAAPFAAVPSDTCAASGELAFYAHRGAGKIVGLAARYHADGGADLGYLEGDERTYRDNAIAPAWYGTGIEDFYNGGFYFEQREYALALSGASEVDRDGTGTTAAYRWMPGDALTYTNALRFAQEAGFAPDQPVPTCARSLVYVYRQAQASTVSYDAFDVGTPAAAAHGYAPPAAAECESLNASFEDEPPTSRNAAVCAYTSGTSHFRFEVNDGVPPLRLRRTFDAGTATPGEIAGAPAAEILVNGVVAGWFPPAIANPARRWQEQEALLDPAAGVGALDIEIVPDFTAHAPRFSESRWALSGGWKDRIFADGFDNTSAVATD
jgi:hypothetical protein